MIEESPTPGARPRSLSKACPGHPWVLPHLALAAGSLLAGQILPGVRIEYINSPPEVYAVMGAVIDLWLVGNPFLAVILFCFSIIFPTAKLLFLGWIWLRPMDALRRARWARALEGLGKWSMLDAFVVTALVGTVQLSKVVTAARAMPRAAAYFFSAAILLSMLATHVVARLAREGVAEDSRPPAPTLDRIAAPWLAAACLVGAIVEPILRVEKRVFENVYALPSSLTRLWGEGEVYLALLVVVFVLALPALHLLGLGHVHFLRRRGRDVPRALAWAEGLGHWAMVDVFFLGVLLVCSKVGNLATLERLPGFWWLLAASVLAVYSAVRGRPGGGRDPRGLSVC